MKLSKRDFDRVVKRAVLRIPVDIRQHLGNILITVQKRPSQDLLEDMSLPPDEPLLGVFQGVPLTERSLTSPIKKAILDRGFPSLYARLKLVIPHYIFPNRCSFAHSRSFHERR
jgi:hypothetical protein